MRMRTSRRRWVLLIEETGMVWPDVFEEYWMGMIFWV